MKLFDNNLYREDLKNIVQYINPKKNINILVTGASGLIGSQIIDTLLYYNQINMKQTFQIYAMARNKERLCERFEGMSIYTELHLLVGDICNPLPDDLQFDIIIHAASNADPGTYSQYPVETIKTNVMGTIQVLEYAKKHLNTRVLFTSTMEVYGEIPDKDVFEEQDFGIINTNLIRSGYPESKRTSELLCRSYAYEFGVDSVITRLGYIYGPTMTKTDNKVVAQFIRNALKKEKIILKSKGEQKRSYCYSADAVGGIFCALFSGLSNEVYNIANKHSVITIVGLAQTLANIANTEVVYSFPPDSTGNINQTNPHNAVLATKKLEELGWKPIYNLPCGLKQTLDIIENTAKATKK